MGWGILSEEGKYSDYSSKVRVGRQNSNSGGFLKEVSVLGAHGGEKGVPQEDYWASDI